MWRQSGANAAVIMTKVGVLLYIATLLVGLTVPVFTEPTTTESSCGPKDVTDAEKEDVQMYLPNNKKKEISTGEQDLSAFEKISTLINTHSETGDQAVSDVDRSSTQATKPSLEWTTSTASSDTTSLPSTGEKISSLPTVTTQATDFSNARGQELTTSTVTTQSTASSRATEQELTTSPTVTPQAITSSHTTGQETSAFPTSAPQTTTPFQNNEQEEFVSSQAKFLTSTEEQAFSFAPEFTSQGAMSSQDREQDSTDSQTPPTIIETINSLSHLHPSPITIAFLALLTGIALFFLVVVIRYLVLQHKCSSTTSEGSYVIDDDSNPNQSLTSFHPDYHRYWEDDIEELEMNWFRPLRVPPSDSDDPSSGQWKSNTL